MCLMAAFLRQNPYLQQTGTKISLHVLPINHWTMQKPKENHDGYDKILTVIDSYQILVVGQK